MRCSVMVTIMPDLTSVSRPQDVGLEGVLSYQYIDSEQRNAKGRLEFELQWRAGSSQRSALVRAPA